MRMDVLNTARLFQIGNDVLPKASAPHMFVFAFPLPVAFAEFGIIECESLWEPRRIDNVLADIGKNYDENWLLRFLLSRQEVAIRIFAIDRLLLQRARLEHKGITDAQRGESDRVQKCCRRPRILRPHRDAMVRWTLNFLLQSGITAVILGSSLSRSKGSVFLSVERFGRTSFREGSLGIQPREKATPKKF